METTSAAGKCPICGEPNDCAIARGEDECWCVKEVFPPNLLERVPSEARGKICACRNCVENARGADER